MMGLPVGWVTDVPGVTRNEALKMLGNGVVPQQAAEALRRLLAGVVMPSADAPGLLPTPCASDWKRDDDPADRQRKSPGLTTVSAHFAAPASDETEGAA